MPSLFQELELAPMPAHKKRPRQSGAAEAESRYSKLKFDLDFRTPYNDNWFEVDTSLSNKEQRKINFVDLFAGAGGMSQGFREAGYRKIFSVEIDPDASKTLRRNFPEAKHFEGPIETLTSENIASLKGKAKIHVLAGGPPCQGFSVAGLRKPDDPRNKLFREYIRVLTELKPDYFVMENVPGILTMEDGKVLREILKQFTEAGYPNTSVRILEAAQFGVPQLRTRAIFVGNRLGRMNPYPKPILQKGSYVPIERAIGDLATRALDPAINHHGTRHSKEMVARLAKVPPGGSLYESFRDAWKRQYRGVPCMTIKENHGGVHIHYELNRVLTAREMARLQTFPDSFFFEGTFKRAYWQIGNAVPCLFARHIAKAIALAATNPRLQVSR